MAAAAAAASSAQSLTLLTIDYQTCEIKSHGVVSIDKQQNRLLLVTSDERQWTLKSLVHPQWWQQQRPPSEFDDGGPGYLGLLECVQGAKQCESMLFRELPLPYPACIDLFYGDIGLLRIAAPDSADAELGSDSFGRHIRLCSITPHRLKQIWASWMTVSQSAPPYAFLSADIEARDCVERLIEASTDLTIEVMPSPLLVSSNGTLQTPPPPLADSLHKRKRYQLVKTQCSTSAATDADRRGGGQMSTPPIDESGPATSAAAAAADMLDDDALLLQLAIFGHSTDDSEKLDDSDSGMSSYDEDEDEDEDEDVEDEEDVESAIVDDEAVEDEEDTNTMDDDDVDLILPKKKRTAKPKSHSVAAADKK